MWPQAPVHGVGSPVACVGLDEEGGRGQGTRVSHHWEVARCCHAFTPWRRVVWGRYWWFSLADRLLAPLLVFWCGVLACRCASVLTFSTFHAVQEKTGTTRTWGAWTMATQITGTSQATVTTTVRDVATQCTSTASSSRYGWRRPCIASVLGTITGNGGMGGGGRGGRTGEHDGCLEWGVCPAGADGVLMVEGSHNLPVGLPPPPTLGWQGSILQRMALVVPPTPRLFPPYPSGPCSSLPNTSPGVVFCFPFHCWCGGPLFCFSWSLPLFFCPVRIMRCG